MQNQFSLTKILEFSQVDSEYNYRIDWMFSDFQALTTFHSEIMKIDAPTMMQKSNAFWVLSKLKVKIESLPKMLQRLTYTTFPTSYTAFRFNRDYTISANDKVCIKATSEWCVLDADTRKLRKTDTVCYPFDMPHVDFTAGCKEFSKIKIQVAQKDKVYSYKTMYTDIDANKHVNNVAYVRMVLNCFSPEQFVNLDIDEFEMYYHAQAFYNQVIDLYMVKTEQGYYIEGKLDQTQTLVFTAVIKTK